LETFEKSKKSSPRKSATKGAKVRAELKTICTADVNVSATLPQWCHLFIVTNSVFFSNCVTRGGPRASS